MRGGRRHTRGRRYPAGEMRVALVLFALLAAMTTACRDDTVAVAFRPDVGATYRYEVRVRTETEIALDGARPEISRDDAVLIAEHRVLDAGPGGVRVQVVLASAGEEPRTFVVRFDRAARLQSIERIEGIPEASLGDIGMSEIFPAAAGAPPDRRLEPGDRWTIDDAVRLPGIEGTPRLRGEGRLVEVGVTGGTDVGRIRTVARLPVRATSETENGDLRIEGAQVTDHAATHDLGDGSVRSSSSRTTGTFTILLSPPPGRPGEPVPGTMRVRVLSETARVR
jgi:hypothetical protein